MSQDDESLPHEPVMVREVTELLNIRPGRRYLDCTVGAGGHTVAILEAGAPDCTALGIDADPEALEVAARRLSPYGDRVRLRHANFRDAGDLCREEGFMPVDGMLLDLGVSSMQLESGSRGFSFREPDAPLDMRFSPKQRRTAAEVVNEWSMDDLAAVLWRYGEERRARPIARQIVAARPIQTVGELARAIEQVAGRVPRKKGRARSTIHPATKTFQALRIVVNEELEALDSALRQAPDLLGFGGRLVVISFHSLEDRIVKRFIQQESRDCICPPGLPVCVCGHVARLRPVTRGALVPTVEEIAANRRARSAKLRAAERIAA